MKTKEQFVIRFNTGQYLYSITDVRWQTITGNEPRISVVFLRIVGNFSVYNFNQ